MSQKKSQQSRSRLTSDAFDSFKVNIDQSSQSGDFESFHSGDAESAPQKAQIWLKQNSMSTSLLYNEQNVSDVQQLHETSQRGIDLKKDTIHLEDLSFKTVESYYENASEASSTNYELKQNMLQIRNDDDNYENIALLGHGNETLEFKKKARKSVVTFAASDNSNDSRKSKRASCFSMKVLAPLYNILTTALFVLSCFQSTYLLEYKIPLDFVAAPYWVNAFTFMFVCVILISELFVYILGIIEDRDLIAVSFIYIQIQRLILIPSSIYMSHSIYYACQTCFKTYFSQHITDFELDNTMNKQENFQAVLDSWAIVLLICSFELLIVVLSCIISCFQHTISNEEEPMYELTQADLNIVAPKVNNWLKKAKENTHQPLQEQSSSSSNYSHPWKNTTQPLLQDQQSDLSDMQHTQIIDHIQNKNQRMSLAQINQLKEILDQQHQHIIDSQRSSQKQQGINNDQSEEEKYQDIIDHQHEVKLLPISIEPIAKIDPNAFNVTEFQSLLDEVIEMSKSNRMQVIQYTLIYRQILNLMKYFGSSLSIAFQDIVNKADKIDEDQKIIKGLNNGIELKSIEELLDFEFSNDMQFLDGNNFRKCNKPGYKMMNEKKDLLWYYQSMGWVIIRGAWFFDFMSEIIKQISNLPHEKSMVSSAQKAYAIGLSRHHPWIVRKAVSVAMNAIAYRQVFENQMIEEQSRIQQRNYTKQDIYHDFVKVSESFNVLAKHIWKYYKDRGLDQIP